MNRPQITTRQNDRSEFADALRKGLLLGAGFLILVLPPALKVPVPHAPGNAQPPPAPVVAVAPKPIAPPSPGVAPRAEPPRPLRWAHFGRTTPSTDVRQMANWVVQSGDHQRKAFVIVDKKAAKVYVFNPQGRLQAAAAALLGEARGDDTAPGIGDKPLSQVLPEEKTTPAGRFIAEMGESSTRGEDVVWVDYDAAVSMHRVIKVKERLRSLASPSTADNRMSFGCINLPRPFYEDVLRPAVRGPGAVIYVLPETRPLREVFASYYEVPPPPVKMAQHRAPTGRL